MSAGTTQVDRDPESGEFESETREKVYEAMPVNTPVIASEITKSTGIPRSTVNYHLNKLADQDRIKKTKHHEKRVNWLRLELGSDN